MENNYNILADYIVSRYIDRISGNDIEETFVDDSPADRVMVGMLAENRMEERFDGGYIENNSTRFESVPSISVSFIVKKNSRMLTVIEFHIITYLIFFRQVFFNFERKRTKSSGNIQCTEIFILTLP